MMPPRLMGNRLTVDPRTLTPLVLVRIQVPQPAQPLTIRLFQPTRRRTSVVVDDSELLCHEQFVALDNFLDHFAFRVEPEIG